MEVRKGKGRVDPHDNRIIANLDRFIRKYYKSMLIKGTLYAVALLLLLFLVVVVLEHFGYFGTGVRTVLFWLYVVTFVVVMAYYVVTPLLKMHRLGHCISYDEAAVIVGNHFPEIKDKLLNLLQLQRAASTEPSADDSLLRAAIEQKTAQISPIPFTGAVDLKRNRRYVKYAAIPLAIVVLIAIIAPSFLSEPSRRLINHNTVYERPAPFAFVLDDASLEVAQQEDFTIRVHVEGDAVPNEAYVVVDGNPYKMHAVDKAHFAYKLKNVQRSVDFHFEGGGVVSTGYRLTVFMRPTVVSFTASLTYPAYIRRAAEVISNVGDMVVPEGTTIQWHFMTRNADTLWFAVGERLHAVVPGSDGRAQLAVQARTDFDYGFYAANGNVTTYDTLRYAVGVVNDAAPMIMAMEMRDSLTPGRVFFRGRIKDDYGFDRLEFHLERTNADDTAVHSSDLRPVAITTEASQDFNYDLNLAEIGINPGDRIRYYFVVYDNDAIHGPKPATSQQFEINIPTDKELDEQLAHNVQDIQHKGQSSMTELKKLQGEIDNMMQRLVDKKTLNYQDKQQLQQLIDKHNEVKDMLQQMQQQIEQNNRLEDAYRQQDERIAEKQQELNKLFDQVMNEEMKQLMQQLEQLMQDVDKKQVQQQLEDLKLKNEDIERQLDQNIDLMKRLELEKRVDETVQKLDKLAEQQSRLADKTEHAKGDEKEALTREQQRLNNEFRQLKQDINQLKQDYKALDPSQELKTDKALEQRVEQGMQQSEQKMQQGRRKEASQQQRQSADDLEQMADDLAQAQEQMEQADAAEDADMIRHLLKSVVTLSFNQEALIGRLNQVYIQDPKYQQIIAEQNAIKADFRNVEDTLRALAKRQMAVASVINKEVSAVNSNVQRALSLLVQYNQSFYGSTRNTSAAGAMQYSMTSLNNLALVMAESLDKMQNQQRQQQQRSSRSKSKSQSNNSCSNPGQGKPSAKSMKEMQEELNRQIDALKKQLDKQGNQPQRARTGQQQGGSMSEEFAKAAAQQEMIRRMMQQYGQELKQQSGGNSKLSKEIDEMMRQMEQTERDLVNKTITQQTLRRQQQIMTRLLEHEKAEMQRDQEQRRQSNEAHDIYQPSPADLERYNRLKEQNTEFFRNIPPTLTPYYKNKVNEYFYQR